MTKSKSCDNSNLTGERDLWEPSVIQNRKRWHLNVIGMQFIGPRPSSGVKPAFGAGGRSDVAIPRPPEKPHQ